MNKINITTTNIRDFMAGRGVGFEPLFNMLDKTRADIPAKYPPYNIIKVNEDKYKIELALAGISVDDITIEIHQNKLTISYLPEGEDKDKDKDSVEYIHKGISSRWFTREFALAEYMTVDKAKSKNGVLTLTLSRKVPEEAKPKIIEIN